MPATTIHFVRHGKVYNPDHLLYERLPDFHLSEQGARMAAATARFMALNPATQAVVAVYASPLERAQETAQIIADGMNQMRKSQGRKPLELMSDERLIEAGNEFRGQRKDRWPLMALQPANWSLMSNLMEPSWGESYRAIAERMRDFAYEQVERYPGQQIIAVSHESPIWAFRRLLETGKPEHNMLLRHTALASVTSITFDVESKNVLGITYANPASGVQ
ncbi:phosphoglycerate mutase [Bombiscardovia apis]|uniref:Phosphoglycerate mutase n=1 Tax=Bombiscardovia apis TaxID=2932182 RepID=A0ABM8BB37_9BIFI|nr:histidine phosphatase family protein [Bombiscardovia apis]BDR54124.1 phosphoglycerate mutase [Bombiscardovia apis]